MILLPQSKPRPISGPSIHQSHRPAAPAIIKFSTRLLIDIIAPPLQQSSSPTNQQSPPSRGIHTYGQYGSHGMDTYSTSQAQQCRQRLKPSRNTFISAGQYIHSIQYSPYSSSLTSRDRNNAAAGRVSPPPAQSPHASAEQAETVARPDVGAGNYRN